MARKPSVSGPASTPSQGRGPREAAAAARLRNAKIELKLLSFEELSRVKTYSAIDGSGGYQRRLRSKKVAQVAELAALGIPSPAVFIAETPDGERYFVDGHHRGEGHRLVKLGVAAMIVHCNLDDARWLFLIINRRVNKLSGPEALAGSRNDIATALQNMATDFDASVSQVHELVKAIRSRSATKGLDFENLDAELTEGEDECARMALAVWTDSALWRRFDQAPNQKTRESVYSGTAILRVVGTIIHEKRANPRRMIEDLHAFKYHTKWGARCAVANLMGSSPAIRTKMWEKVTKLLDRSVRSEWNTEQHDEKHANARAAMISERFGVTLDVH